MKKIICISIMLTFVFCLLTYATQIPQGQSIGSTVREYEDEREREKTFQRLAKDMKKTPSLTEEELDELPRNKESIYVGEIKIQSDLAINPYANKNITNLIKEYRRKNMTLEDMKELCSYIEQEYADKNIRVYVPRQTFFRGILYINFVSK